MITMNGFINTWGNGAAFRITKSIANASGIDRGTPVKVTAEHGRIVIEAQQNPTLEQMLNAFDPQLHRGEIMAFSEVGKELLE